MTAARIAAVIVMSVGVAASRLDASVFQGAVAARNDDSLLVRAESLLSVNNLPEARRAAERYEDRHRNDPRGLILLGRIHLLWPVVGRFAAESLFARAIRLDRTNPEPHYYTAEVGVRLGGEDGEEFIHRGVIGALSLNPDYRDTWKLWQPIYHNDGRRREMVGALARHAGRTAADYRRGQLLTELARYAEAAALLDTVVRQRPTDPGAAAWQARALFALGRDAGGIVAYEAALDNAARDTGQVLWRQVRGISSPDERTAFESTRPEMYPAFFRLFWSRRVPDLATPVNGRFAEHFHRLAQAMREFALLHPNSRYFKSALYRARSGGVGMPLDVRGETAAAFDNAASTQCTGRRNASTNEMIRAGIYTPSDTLSTNPTNREDDIDDRGLIFLRHGPADFRAIGPHGNSETWCYLDPAGGSLRVSFLRRTGGSGGSGDFVITAMATEEVEAARKLLVTDRTVITRRDLAFSFSVVSFRAADNRSTEVVIITDPVQGVAALLNEDGREADRQPGTGGPVRLAAAPGPYVLLFDASRDGRQNRYRGPTLLRDYGGTAPAISSILIAAGATPPQRDSMIRASTPKRELPASRPVRVYTEVYNLGAREGASHYTATYSFERLDGFILRASRQRVSTISFQREARQASRLIESLVIDPGQLPSGRYRLRVDVTDAAAGAEAVSNTVEFRLR